MSQSQHLLHSHLTALKLPTFRREYEAIARQCAKEEASYATFLERLAELELQQRRAQAIERRLKQAQFPVVKELDQFDFTAAPKVGKKRIEDLAKCSFIDQRSNLVFVGPPGTGKSHLSIALGREACRRGYKVRFFTAAGLANAYIEAREEKQVTRLENHIRRCDLIVIDELGYVPLQREAAEHLFSFFSQCYEITSLIVTTNLPFADWPQVFAGDERMAGALLDRLTHHVQIVEMEGESYRLKHGGQRRQGQGKRKRAKGTDKSQDEQGQAPDDRDQSQETDQQKGGDAEDTTT